MNAPFDLPPNRARVRDDTMRTALASNAVYQAETCPQGST